MERASPERLPASMTPEHDWAAAAPLLEPTLRPLGTAGVDGLELRRSSGSGSLPILGTGPAGLPIVYVLPADGFDVLVGVDHLLSWGVGPGEVHAAAMANLGAWSATAPWTDEMDGSRRITWSDSGDGCDASRILLPGVRQQLGADLGAAGRVLIGLPERHLLMAASLVAGDEDFAELLAGFIEERFEAADEPVDGRLFELVAGELVAFAPVPALP